jgi:hypothetical protein
LLALKHMPVRVVAVGGDQGVRSGRRGRGFISSSLLLHSGQGNSLQIRSGAGPFRY